MQTWWRKYGSFKKTCTPPKVDSYLILFFKCTFCLLKSTSAPSFEHRLKRMCGLAENLIWRGKHREIGVEPSPLITCPHSLWPVVLLGGGLVIIFLQALRRTALMAGQIGNCNVFRVPVTLVVITDWLQSCGVLSVCLPLKLFASLDWASLVCFLAAKSMYTTSGLSLFLFLMCLCIFDLS